MNISQELGKLIFLEGRSKETTSEEESAAFAKLASYRDGAAFAGSFCGESPWERIRTEASWFVFSRETQP